METCVQEKKITTKKQLLDYQLDALVHFHAELLLEKV